MGRVALSFANASCAHCVRTVSKRLGEIDGIRMMEIDSDALRIVVHFDSSRVSVDEIRMAMEESGYPTTVLEEMPGAAARSSPRATAA